MWTPEELRSRGASKSEIERQRRKAEKVRHGVYTTTHAGDEWELYRLRCVAVVNAITGAVLTGPSAAAMWDLPMVDSPPEYVYIREVTPGRYGHDVRVVVGGHPVVQSRAGILMTSVAWAIADCARIMSKRDALIAADAALHRGLCEWTDIQAAADSLGRSKHIGRVRWVLHNTDPRSESPGETWLRMIVKDLGFAVTSQVWVSEPGFTARVDLMVDGHKVVLEFDGLIKYNGEKSDVVERAIRNEKIRQAELERLGYQVLRFIWEQLYDIECIRRRLSHAVSRAGIERSAHS